MGASDKRASRRKYEAEARSYDRLYGKEQMTKLLDVYSCGWRPREKLLDLGCGTGLIASKLAEHCGLVVGLDVSEGMVRQGKRRRRVEFVLGNALWLPFRSGSFDSAVCFTSFHHFPKKDATVDEIARVTRKGSRLVFTLLRERADRDSQTLKSSEWLQLELEGEAGRDELLIFKRV